MSMHTSAPELTKSTSLEDDSRASKLWRGCLNSNVLVFCLLLAVNLICVGSSLNMFFFAEDTIHVVHAHNAFNGLPHYFWTNFYSVWMADNVHTSFYRPIAELTFAVDYMLFGTNPFGYHLTNLVWHQLSTFTLFIAAAALLKRYGIVQARITAAISAVLFATCPLHPEAINWLVNRTDLMCMTFMMLSWYIFIQRCNGSRTNLPTILSLTCMLIALMCKESAIAIPPLMVLTHLLLSANGWSFKDIKSAIRATSAFWMLLLVYVIFRFVILHGPGGYVGSLATMLSNTFFERLTSVISWLRCFYPLNECLSKADLHLLGPLLALGYTLAGIIVLTRLKLRCWSDSSTRIVLFAFAAFFVTFAPALQLWGILSNLLNTRLMYIPSAFLALAVAATVLPIGLPGKTQRTLWKVGIVWSVVFATITGMAHRANNQPWHTASDNLKCLSSELVSTIKRLPSSDSLAVLNLPLDERNPLTMCCRWHLIAPAMPPFADKDMRASIAATQFSWFNSEIKNPSRIAEFIESPRHHGLLWDASTSSFVECARGAFPDFGASLDGANPWLYKGEDGREPSSIYCLPPSGLDFRLAGLIKVTVAPRPYSRHNPSELPHCTIIWTSHDRPEVTTWRTITKHATKSHADTIYIPVAELVRWRLSPQRINQLIATPADGYSIESIVLLDEKSMVPTLKINCEQTKDGLFELGKEQTISFDSSKIEDAKSVVIEIAAPNLRLHELSATYRDTELSKHSYKHIAVPSTKGTFCLKREMFGKAARYDVRIAAISEANQVVGFTSDPLEVDVR